VSKQKVLGQEDNEKWAYFSCDVFFIYKWFVTDKEKGACGYERDDVAKSLNEEHFSIEWVSSHIAWLKFFVRMANCTPTVSKDVYDGQNGENQIKALTVSKILCFPKICLPIIISPNAH